MMKRPLPTRKPLVKKANKLANTVVRTLTDVQALTAGNPNYSFFGPRPASNNPVVNYGNNPLKYSMTRVVGLRFSAGINILTEVQLNEFYNAIVRFKKGTFEYFEADLGSLMRPRIKSVIPGAAPAPDKLIVEYEDTPFRFGNKILKFTNQDNFEVAVQFKSLTLNNVDLRCHFYTLTSDNVNKSGI